MRNWSVVLYNKDERYKRTQVECEFNWCPGAPQAELPSSLHIDGEQATGANLFVKCLHRILEYGKPA